MAYIGTLHIAGMHARIYGSYTQSAFGYLRVYLRVLPCILGVMALLVHSRSALLCIPSTRASANSFAGIHIRVYILGVCIHSALAPCHVSLVRHHADTSERNSREYDTIYIG